MEGFTINQRLCILKLLVVVRMVDLLDIENKVTVDVAINADEYVIAHEVVDRVCERDLVVEIDPSGLEVKFVDGRPHVVGVCRDEDVSISTEGSEIENKLVDIFEVELGIEDAIVAVLIHTNMVPVRFAWLDVFDVVWENLRHFEGRLSLVGLSRGVPDDEDVLARRIIGALTRIVVDLGGVGEADFDVTDLDGESVGVLGLGRVAVTVILDWLLVEGEELQTRVVG